jgi:uncharacterized protein
MKNISAYVDFLGETFGPKKSLAKLLKTESGYYLYDTGTNKILGCRKEVYDFLNGLFLEDVNRAAGDFVSKYGQTEFLFAAEEIVEAINIGKIMPCREYLHLYKSLLELQK